MGVPAFAVFQRRRGKGVEREHIDPGQFQQNPSDAAVAVRHAEFAEQFRDPLSRQAFGAIAKPVKLKIAPPVFFRRAKAQRGLELQSSP